METRQHSIPGFLLIGLGYVAAIAVLLTGGALDPLAPINPLSTKMTLIVFVILMLGIVFVTAALWRRQLKYALPLLLPIALCLYGLMSLAECPPGMVNCVV